MVDPVTPSIGFSGGFSTAAVGAAANKAGYAFAVTALYVTIMVGVVVLIGFLLYKKSFNIRITIFDNTKGGIIIKDNYRGKLTQSRPGEFRFRIYKEKANNFRYNQESISPDDLYIDVSTGGKIKKRLFMSYDDEGQLVVMKLDAIKMIRHKRDSKGLLVYDDTGRPVYEQTSELKSLVKQVDVAWYFKELDKSQELFDPRSFFDKNGWIIMIIVLVLVLGCFLYTAYKFGGAANKMTDVVAQQGELIKYLALMRNGTAVAI